TEARLVRLAVVPVLAAIVANGAEACRRSLRDGRPLVFRLPQNAPLLQRLPVPGHWFASGGSSGHRASGAEHHRQQHMGAGGAHRR
ncbi:hypothetical protein M9458_022933, partial [Cirrhinus mrigala]